MSDSTIAPLTGRNFTSHHPAQIQSVPGGYLVPGLASVASRPHRSTRQAIEIIERIAGDFSYLAGCNELHVVGVVDLRKAGA